MRTKDTILLERVYNRILLKENPDNSLDPRSNEILSFRAPGAVPFGFVNIDKPYHFSYRQYTQPKENVIPLVFRGFGPEFTDRVVLRTNHNQKDLTHFDLYASFLSGLFKNSEVKQGIIEGGLFSFKGIPDTVDFSKPEEILSKLNKDLSLERNVYKALCENMTVDPRKFLYPSGRLWLDQQVISFWAEEGEVRQELLVKLFNTLNIPMEQAGQYYIEFLGDDKPRAIVKDYLSGNKNTYSKEEQAARDKKAAEDMAKAHGAAAVGTKDKDVQKIIDARKKAMAERESELRAKGIRPSLQTRQQTMTSESSLT